MKKFEEIGYVCKNVKIANISTGGMPVEERKVRMGDAEGKK